MRKYLFILIIISFSFQGCEIDSERKNKNSNFKDQQKCLTDITVSPSESTSNKKDSISLLLKWFDIQNEDINLTITTSSSLHGKTHEYVTIKNVNNSIKMSFQTNSSSKEVILSKEKVLSAINELVKSVSCLNEASSYTISSVTKKLLIIQKDKEIEFYTRNPKWKGIEKFKQDIFDL